MGENSYNFIKLLARVAALAFCVNIDIRIVDTTDNGSKGTPPRFRISLISTHHSQSKSHV